LLFIQAEKSPFGSMMLPYKTPVFNAFSHIFPWFSDDFPPWSQRKNGALPTMFVRLWVKPCHVYHPCLGMDGNGLYTTYKHANSFTKTSINLLEFRPEIPVLYGHKLG